MDSIKITPVPDDRLQRMNADPEKYFQEANIRAEKIIAAKRQKRQPWWQFFTKTKKP